MDYEERKAKLSRVLESYGVDDPTDLAGYILRSGFDYVPYVAAKSAKRAMHHYDDFLKKDINEGLLERNIVGE